MKRRNADAGKMRRPLKRTKITEGMYGNSMLYLKFVMLWASVVMADYMLEFRFEFLWPFWMMLRSVYDSFKYQGLAFSMFFICIALTSDMICFFFIPVQYIFFAASTYVWVQYVWYTFAEKGICLPTVAICCAVVYVEGAWRGERSELCRPLAAHCVGFPAVSLGFGVKSYVGHRLRMRTQRHVRAQNEFYFQLMRDALPESALEQNQQQPSKEAATVNSTEVSGAASANTSTGTGTGTDARHMNGSVRRRKPELNGHCGHEHAQLHIKLEKLEKHLAQQTAAREREKTQQNQSQTQTHTHAHATHATHAHAHTQHAAGAGTSHALSNGTAPGAHADEDDHRHDHSKGGSKSSKLEKKEANTLKEEKRKNRHKDKDKESNDSHKSTEHVKEHIVKEKDVESTKDNVKSKECNNNNKDKEKEKRDREGEREREREKERETREREKEKEKEKERERERELRSMRSCAEELRRVRAELAAARSAEADARRALAAAERQRRHHQHQHKASTWRGARPSAELARARPAPRTTSVCCSGECESDWCRAALQRAESEAAALRRDLARATDALTLLRADLHRAADQVRTLEARQEESTVSSAPATAAGVGPGVGTGVGSGVGAGWHALHQRATHLERSLSAETRVKLDLLSALGDAKRKMHLQESVISRQEKEIEELKAQMLAVMPAEFVTAVSGAVSKLRLADGSPLDPNASVYTPKQLCSDA